MNVLVVDDNEINRKLLRVMLSADEHRTVEYANGLEALETLEEDKFDALIADILMPGMDGSRRLLRVMLASGACQAKHRSSS